MLIRTATKWNFSNSFAERIFKSIKFVYAFSTFLIKIIIITIVFNTRDKVRQRVQCTHDLMRTQSHVNPQNETITILWRQRHNDNSTAGWQCLFYYSIHSFEMKKSFGQFNLFVYQMHCCHFHTMAHCVTVHFKVKYLRAIILRIYMHLAT